MNRMNKINRIIFNIIKNKNSLINHFNIKNNKVVKIIYNGQLIMMICLSRTAKC